MEGFNIDLVKTNYINEIGSRWTMVPCESLPEVSDRRRCENIKRELSKYAYKMVKVQGNLQLCNQLFDEPGDAKHKGDAYHVCMQDVNDGLNKLITKYHKKLHDVVNDKTF